VQFETEEMSFWSGPGVRIAARLYKPAAGHPPGPGIVFCHGFGGTKDGTPPGLSKLLAARGYRVLTFDYRGQGGSDGPRGRLAPREQIEDAVHALEYLAQRPDVDASRLGIYGTSFGGGIAAMAARRSGRPRAVAMTVPVTSGGDWLRSMMRRYEFEDLRSRAMQAMARKTTSGEFEMVDRFDIMVPDPLTRERYTDKVPMALETVYHVLDYEAIDEAHQLRTPALVIAVNGDVLVPTEQAVAYYDRLAGPKKLHVFERGSHFSVYDELLPAVAEMTLEWFETHLHENHA
jgi:hypothetical protein